MLELTAAEVLDIIEKLDPGVTSRRAIRERMPREITNGMISQAILSLLRYGFIAEINSGKDGIYTRDWRRPTPKMVGDTYIL